MAQNQVFQWWTRLPRNTKTIGIAIVAGLVVLIGAAILYDISGNSSNGHLSFTPVKETVTCSDQAANPGFNFPLTLTNSGNKPVYWSVIYAPSASTATIRNFQHNRLRVTLSGGALLVSGNLNVIPADGQATLNVLGNVDEAWSLTFSYSTDPNDLSPQVTTFSLGCS
jgi:hypothetical protein